MSLSIYVSTHKEGFVPTAEPFVPIQVGAAMLNESFCDLKDNTGLNISHKNKNFCELTAQYWVWKNGKQSDYVGFCHYRRYFDVSRRVQHTLYKKENTIENFFEANQQESFERILEGSDFIVAKPFRYYHSIANTLSTIIQADDLAILERVIEEHFPDYREAFVFFMYHNNKISSCNMFITRWELFEQYSKWLFAVLEKVELEIKISAYTTPARVFGFLGEALLNVFLLRNKFRIQEKPLIVFRDDVENDPDHIFILKEIRRMLSFKFNRPPLSYKMSADNLP